MSSSARSVLAPVLSLLIVCVAAQTITTPPASTTPAAAPSITAVSDCHAHGTTQFCMWGTTEYQVIGPTKTEQMEPQYTGCHSHGSEIFCLKKDGEEVQLEEPGHGHEPHSGGKNCHFHAGVEHCVDDHGSDELSCERTDRHYNVPLRIGLLFVILVTSALGVFTPILATSFTRMSQKSLFFVILKQFGTGVVISTAFIHLFTHANLMFANKCLGELAYEGTTAAIFMAGLCLSFLIDYLSARFIMWRQAKDEPVSDTEKPPSATDKSLSGAPKGSTSPTGIHTSHIPNSAHVHDDAAEKLSVLVLEAGVIFHSLLIGLTLVVAGDSFFKTLFAVILFHQMFEGIALGTCIAGLAPTSASLVSKLFLGLAFALITPLGMAIGIGVLDQFNGNSKPTIVAIGTLDALSAGILAWVGIVEMLGKDWLHGVLLNAGLARTLVAMTALISGLVVMSALGKWA